MIHNAYIIDITTHLASGGKIRETEVFGTREEAEAYCSENEISTREIKHRWADDCGSPTFLARKAGEETEAGAEIWTDYLDAVKQSLAIENGETAVWLGETQETSGGLVTV